MSEKITINGQEAEVISRSRGWIKALTADGKAVSVRAKSDGESPRARPAKKAARKSAGAKQASGTKTIGETEVDLSKYHQHVTASGNKSLDNGDKVAKQLRDLTLDQVYRETAKAVKEDLEAATIEEAEKALRKRYAKLNPGMQRMNLGNRLRAALRAS